MLVFPADLILVIFIQNPNHFKVDIKGKLPTYFIAVFLEDLTLDGGELFLGKLFELFEAKTKVEEEFFLALEAEFLHLCVVYGGTVHALVLTAVVFDTLLETGGFLAEG